MAIGEVELDEIERIVSPPDQQQQPVGAPVDELDAQGEEPECLMLFVQTKCGLQFQAQWATDESAGTYIITGARQLEILVGKLRMRPEQIEGCLSPKSIVDVADDKREGAGIPLHAHTFCFIHPLKSFSNLLWPRAADALRAMRHSRQGRENSEDVKWIDAVLEGGFAYFNSDGEIMRVNAISLQRTETEMVFCGRQVEAPNVAIEMDRAGRLADIADESEFTAGYRKVGWVHSMEKFGPNHQLVSNKHEYYDGGFLVLKASKVRGESDETWFYIMIDPDDVLYQTYRTKAQQQLSDHHDGHGRGYAGAYYEGVRRETTEVVDEQYEDILVLVIEPDVDLQLSVNWKVDTEAGEYMVLEPRLQNKAVSRMLETELELTPDQLQGSLSPKHVVSMPSESRPSYFVPDAAVKFCFVSPLKDKEALARIRKLSPPQLARHPWTLALLLGSFAYFDDAPAATGLVLFGHQVEAVFAQNEMDSEGRLIEILQPNELHSPQNGGWEQFGWVDPNEIFGGKKVSSMHHYEMGGFLYIREKQKTYLYALTTPSASLSTKAKKSKSQGLLSGGYETLIHSARDARSRNREAKKLLEKAFEKKDQTQYRWWQLSAEAREASPVKQQLWDNGISVLYLSSFVGLGVLLYHVWGSDWDSGTDEYPDGKPWSTTEAVYFSVVTMSTVGYGDMGVKQEALPMLITAIYIIIGTLVVFQHAGNLYNQIFHFETGLISKCIQYLRGRCAKGDPVDLATDAGEDAEKLSCCEFFKKHLMWGIISGLILNVVLFALVFKWIDRVVPDDVTEEVSFASYLWHCFITSTTVGFGDVLQGRYVSQEMLICAIVHILISVSWLSSTASQVSDALEARRHDERRVKALNDDLNESQIEDMGHFLKNGKLDKWGYVLGKLIDQGAQLWGEDLTVENQIEKLAKQFDAFDEYGTGFLSKNDLAHMLLHRQQQKKLDQALEYAKKAEYGKLKELLFPDPKDDRKCALPNEVINSLPLDRAHKPRQYGLLHELIAVARMDKSPTCIDKWLRPMASAHRYEKAGKHAHDELVKRGILFDYTLKTSTGDTCMDVALGDRYAKPEPQVWKNDLFANFLLSKDCPKDEFSLHSQVYWHANDQDWEAVQSTIFCEGKQVLSNTLINSLAVVKAEDDSLFRPGVGLLHQLAHSPTTGWRIHNSLVTQGVSFNYNLKTMAQDRNACDKLADKIAEEIDNKEFLEVVRLKRLEQACRLASKKHSGQEIIDLLFDRGQPSEQLVPDEYITLELVQVDHRKNERNENHRSQRNEDFEAGQYNKTPPALRPSRGQYHDENWAFIHYLANWTEESRDKFFGKYEKRKCTGTAVHDILCDLGVKFDYGLKTQFPLPPRQQRVAQNYCAALPKARTCVDVALAAKNEEFTNTLLNLICDRARDRDLEGLDDILIDNDQNPAIPTALLNSLPRTRGEKQKPGLLHYLALWVDKKKWKPPKDSEDSEDSEEREWTGKTWHDRLVKKGVKFNYALKTPRDVDSNDIPELLHNGPKTVTQVAKEANNRDFLKMLLKIACDYATDMQPDRLQELIFDSSYTLLMDDELINELPEGGGGTLLHRLAAWTTRVQNVNGLDMLKLMKNQVKFDYGKVWEGKTADDIASEAGNVEFSNMLDQLVTTSAEASTQGDSRAASRVGGKLKP